LIYLWTVSSFRKYPFHILQVIIQAIPAEALFPAMHGPNTIYLLAPPGKSGSHTKTGLASSGNGL